MRKKTMIETVHENANFRKIEEVADNGRFQVDGYKGDHMFNEVKRTATYDETFERNGVVVRVVSNT